MNTVSARAFRAIHSCMFQIRRRSNQVINHNWILACAFCGYAMVPSAVLGQEEVAIEGAVVIEQSGEAMPQPDPGSAPAEGPKSEPAGAKAGMPHPNGPPPQGPPGAKGPKSRAAPGAPGSEKPDGEATDGGPQPVVRPTSPGDRAIPLRLRFARTRMG